MRLRQVWIALLALVVASGIAMAQPPPKKKKKKRPKKPTTHQPVAPQPPPEPEPDDDDADAGEPPDPPKIDTTLKEEDPAAPKTNPWASSGLVVSKAAPASASTFATTTGPAPSSSSSSSPTAPPPSDPSAGAPHGPISVNAFGGYASSNLRIGFGARGGYTLANHVFVGGSFTYHLGTNIGTATENFFYPGGEVGYDYRPQSLSDVTIRPYAGLALFVAHFSDPGNPLVTPTTNAFFGFYPGVQFDYQLPRAAVFVGADMRLLLIVGDTGQDPAFSFFFLAGARFGGP